MNWSQYSKRFRKAAYKHRYDKEYINRCLTYAKSLYEKDLPIIYDQEHLAVLFGYSIEYLCRASNDQSKFYRKFKISKLSGGFRNIAEPLPSLKEIQRWVLNNILYKCQISEFSKAFKPGVSI